ncbi:hypothetical protein JNJ66_07540 [Candidatus Saccharibacteria bacterium]|nr:hypothetical protein [Candidatus Saccharibacteria bacterium]
MDEIRWFIFLSFAGLWVCLIRPDAFEMMRKDVLQCYRLLYILSMLASTYAIGAGLKYSGLGPEWLRWHAGDLLYPILFAWLYQRVKLHRMRPSENLAGMRQNFSRRVIAWRSGLLVGLTVCLVYEMVVTPLLARWVGPIPFVGGEIDPFDIFVYLAGFMVGYFILARAIVIGHREFQELDVEEVTTLQPTVKTAAPAAARRRPAELPEAWQAVLDGRGAAPVGSGRPTRRRHRKRTGKR